MNTRYVGCLLYALSSLEQYVVLVHFWFYCFLGYEKVVHEWKHADRIM